MTPFDVLRACFPAGTVTGAPKVRAMQIISELEGYRRGPYAGAVGYVLPGGTMDTCIALRTMVVADGSCISRPVRAWWRLRPGGRAPRMSGEARGPRGRDRLAEEEYA